MERHGGSQRTGSGMYLSQPHRFLRFNPHPRDDIVSPVADPVACSSRAAVFASQPPPPRRVVHWVGARLALWLYQQRYGLIFTRRPKRLILLRHGESVGNVDKAVYQTIPDHRSVGTRRSYGGGDLHPALPPSLFAPTPLLSGAAAGGLRCNTATPQTGPIKHKAWYFFRFLKIKTPFSLSNRSSQSFY